MFKVDKQKMHKHIKNLFMQNLKSSGNKLVYTGNDNIDYSENSYSYYGNYNNFYSKSMLEIQFGVEYDKLQSVEGVDRYFFSEPDSNNKMKLFRFSEDVFPRQNSNDPVPLLHVLTCDYADYENSNALNLITELDSNMFELSLILMDTNAGRNYDPGKGLNLNKIRGESPLYILAMKGDIMAAKLLLEHGANPISNNDGTCKPIQDSLATPNSKIGKLLISHTKQEHLKNLPADTVKDFLEELLLHCYDYDLTLTEKSAEEVKEYMVENWEDLKSTMLGIYPDEEQIELNHILVEYDLKLQEDIEDFLSNNSLDYQVSVRQGMPLSSMEPQDMPFSHHDNAANAMILEEEYHNSHSNSYDSYAVAQEIQVQREASSAKRGLFVGEKRSRDEDAETEDNITPDEQTNSSPDSEQENRGEASDSSFIVTTPKGKNFALHSAADLRTPEPTYRNIEEPGAPMKKPRAEKSIAEKYGDSVQPISLNFSNHNTSTDETAPEGSNSNSLIEDILGDSGDDSGLEL